MTNIKENNKRIVKNTLYLYVRMVVMMSLSFFSTRIVLQVLGVDNYGLYNVIGGFVALFTILNSILQTGTRRFLALNIGKGDSTLLKHTFSTAFVIHCGIALVVVVLLETFGLWFLNSDLNIAPDRMEAANYVFQFSVLSVFLSITQTPFTAAVTAHEKFDIYAYMSIFDVVAKIAVLYFLYISPFDKLIVYGALLLLVSTINIFIYRIYCMRKFEECHFSLHVDKPLFKEMCSFSAWSTLGHLSPSLNTHVTSIWLNMFFNTAVNAARGLTGTVSFAIEQLVTGFIVAAVPQLTKYYGAGESDNFNKLIFNISQYTLFLLSIIAVPVLLEIDFVLELWLGEVPDYTAIFIKITIITYLIKYSSIMVDQGLNAIGRVKELTLVTSPVYLFNLLPVYWVLKAGCPPWAVYAVSVATTLAGFVICLVLLKKYAHFPAKVFFYKIFLKNALLVVLAAILPAYLHCIMKDGWLRFLTVCSTSVIITVVIIFYGSLNKEVQAMVKNKIGKTLKIKCLQSQS